MKVVLSVCTLAAAVFAAAGAPAYDDVFIPEPSVYYNGPQPYRPRRSFGATYTAPCASGGYGGYSPVHASYGGGYGGGHAYGGAQAYSGAQAYGGQAYGAHAPYAAAQAYGSPHYRADESAETEILNFSDMEPGMTEHMPMARYGYGGAGAAHAVGGLGYAGQLAPAVASGPAVGVFPNANVGGCNVPLLLSCSPSIVPGRLVKSGGYSGGYGSSSGGYSSSAGVGLGTSVGAAGNSYRSDEQPHQEHEEHVEQEHHALEHTEDSVHSDAHQ